MSDLPAIFDPGEIMESVIIAGDLSKLTPSERVQYYRAVCRSLGLNELTQPFEYMELDGKLTLYARRGTTDQLRDIKKITILSPVEREIEGDLYIVRVRARTEDGREDEAEGVVSLVKEKGEWKTTDRGKRYFHGLGQWEPLRGEDLARARMRAETKAKRRVTLSICGLGWIDEIERDLIPVGSREPMVDMDTGEIFEPSAQEPTTRGLLTPIPPKPANGGSKKPPSSEAIISQLRAQLQTEGIPANEWAGWLICEGKLEAHPKGDHLANLRPSQLQGILSRWQEALAAYRSWRRDHLAEAPPQEEDSIPDDQPEESSAKVARAQELAPRVELHEGYAVVPSYSIEGVTYQVAIDEGGMACQCPGYLYRVQANPDYQCAHVMATKIALAMAAPPPSGVASG